MNQFPLKDWVITTAALNEGDPLVYLEDSQFVYANYVGEVSDAKFGTICVQIPGKPVVDIINIMDTITYKCQKCTCGAKHTSFPNYHLNYCQQNQQYLQHTATYLFTFPSK